MSDPIPLYPTEEDLARWRADPVCRLVLDPPDTTFEEALSVLDPEPDDPAITRLDRRRGRSRP